MHGLLVALVTLLTAFCLGTPAQAREWKAGRDYFELFEKQPVETGAKIEVREAFWYLCPHCAELEPYLDKWLKSGKPANAEFVRMPAVLRDFMAFHARTFYAFEALGIVDQAHPALFKEIHERKNRIGTAQEMAAFASRFGVKEQDFLDAFRSFSVDAKLRWATRLSEKYELQGVPTIIVDGKYRASVTEDIGREELFQLVNYLVGKAAAERRGAQAVAPPAGVPAKAAPK